MANQGPSKAPDNQERRALLSYALFRWESAAVLALTLILVVLVPDPFGGLLPAWRWWFWLLLGLLAETLIFGTTLLDPDVRARLANERLRAYLAPNTIANVDYRQAAERALRQQAEVELLYQRTRRRVQREQLRPILDDYPDPNQAPAQAESLLQDSLRALETSYARLQLIAAQDLSERRTGQLRGEIAQNLRVLQETMESFHEP